MPDSPASKTPYEVLGVSSSADQDELRRAYRRLLRQTHPDVGGSPAHFHAVQLAWEHIGDPAARAAYDRGSRAAYDRGSGAQTSAPDAGQARPAARRTRPEGTAPRARSYGHPGGQARERFLSLMREWVGRGTTISDPYDAALVRTAPREIRHWLAKALAEEATARAVSTLGIGYTIWSDVAAGRGKLDHVVLGPAGLFAVQSQDWGSPVRLLRGEIVAEGMPPGESPLRAASRSAKELGKSLRVRFTAVLIVVPDDDLAEPVVTAGRKGDLGVVRRSVLPGVLRDGLVTGERTSIEDVFEVRSRLQHGIRFV